MSCSRSPLRAAPGAILVAGLAACSSTATPGADVTAPPGGGTVLPGNGSAHVRVVQAVSDAAKGVDVGANGAPALRALPFGAFFPYTQGEYQEVPAASQLSFTATGAATPFYNQIPSAVAANAYATVIAFGRATAAGPTGATVVALSDTNANAPASGLVRVFNTIDYVTPGAGTPVDVYVYAQGAARPATPDVSGLAWGARSAYVNKPAGTLRVDVFVARAAGTGAPLFTGTVPTSAGSVRTLVLTDPPAGAAAGGVLALFDYN